MATPKRAKMSTPPSEMPRTRGCPICKRHLGVMSAAWRSLKGLSGKEPGHTEVDVELVDAYLLTAREHLKHYRTCSKGRKRAADAKLYDQHMHYLQGLATTPAQKAKLPDMWKDLLALPPKGVSKVATYDIFVRHTQR